MGFHIGVDTGGTFTDLVAIDHASGATRIAKVPSTPDSPWRRCRGDQRLRLHVGCDRRADGRHDGRDQRAARAQGRARAVRHHDQGFEDVPFIQRINRKYLYDLQWTKPEPLVARRDCLGVRERVDASGGRRRARATTSSSARDPRSRRASRRRPGSPPSRSACCSRTRTREHERRVGERLCASASPTSPSPLSTRRADLARVRARQRPPASTRYLKPLVGGFAAETAGALDAEGMRRATGRCSSRTAARRCARRRGDRPIDLMLSGLAAASSPGASTPRRLGRRDVVTLDMGGTSADVGLVVDGEIALSAEYEIEWGLPVARTGDRPQDDRRRRQLDRAGSTRAASSRRPAERGRRARPRRYGRGGTEATVTDANLVLGRLDPGYFLGGRLQLEHRARDAGDRGARASSARAGSRTRARRSSRSRTRTWRTRSRCVTVERGHRPARVRAARVRRRRAAARRRRRRRSASAQVIVPPYPGLCSAFGRCSPTRVDRRWTQAFRSNALDVRAASRSLRAARSERAADELGREGFAEPGHRARDQHALPRPELRARGPAASRARSTPTSLDRRSTPFHAAHEERYGYAIDGRRSSSCSFNVTGRGARALASPPLDEVGASAPSARRPVHFPRRAGSRRRIVPRARARARATT